MTSDHERRHRARRLAYAIRTHEIEAVERAAFYAIVRPTDSSPSIPLTDDERASAESESR